MRTRLLGVVSVLALSAAARATAQAPVPAPSPQPATLRGTVRSDQGAPIEGAVISLPALGIASATAANGRFLLGVPGARVTGQPTELHVRAIGYRPARQTFTLREGVPPFDIILAADINRLEEIVVTGVQEGTERVKVPFAVDVVDVMDVPAPALSPIQAIAGRVAGATVLAQSGRPGTFPSVILRGPTSLLAPGRSQGPLYIVDGIILSEGDLPDVNPADIENVEVVKGAAAASLYGSRAGSGVIQITTRSGRRAPHGVSMTARVEYGASDIEGAFELARSHYLLMDEWNERFCVTATGAPLCASTIDWRTEAARINNEPGMTVPQPALFPVDVGAGLFSATETVTNSFQTRHWPGRNWNPIDQFVDPKPTLLGQFDATVRSERTQVYTSLAGVGQGGAIRYLQGYERWSGRLNVDQQLGDRTAVSLRTYYARSTQDGGDQESGRSEGFSGDAFFRLTRQPAIADLTQRDTLGRLYTRTVLQTSGAQNTNPLYLLSAGSSVQTGDLFLAALTLRTSPATWMDLEGNFSYDLAGDHLTLLRDRRVTVGTASGGELTKTASRSEGWNASFNALVRRRVRPDLLTGASLRYLYEEHRTTALELGGSRFVASGVPQLSNVFFYNRFSSSEITVRSIGIFGGVNAIYRDRYIVDALVRRDGSSLFGPSQRWATFGRASVAWRVAQEPFWPLRRTVDEFKLRASRGSAGGRPPYAARYETFTASGGEVSLGQLGNDSLRPEKTVETEVGADLQVLGRYGLSVTYAASRTYDQILQMPAPAVTGFPSHWRNAGTLQNRTWELALTLPVARRRDWSWTWNVVWDRNRTTVLELDGPATCLGGRGQNAACIIWLADPDDFGGAYTRFGTIDGYVFARECSQLPEPFRSDCGYAGASYQRNDEGWLVWVGPGNSWRDGITRNLWGTRLPGCTDRFTGRDAPCGPATDTTAPWGVDVAFGMPIQVVDSTADPYFPVGNALPDWHLAVSQTFQWRRLTVYAMVEGLFGRDVWNQGRHWALLDLLTAEVDQRGKTPETAKPIGYYWRGGQPASSGFYAALQPTNYAVEDASFVKIRELAVAYHLGRLGGSTDWTVSLIGRNLMTFTDYRGFDPEVGQYGGTGSSGIINAIDQFAFPNLRSVTFSLAATF